MKNVSIKLLLCVFLSPLICMAESVIDWEVPETKPPQPHYKSCQSMDISSLDSKSEKSEKKTSTEAKFCLDCSKEETTSNFKEIKEITEANFKTQLRKRAIGQVETKIYQTEILRACLQFDKSFFKEREIKWSQEKCKESNKDVVSSVNTIWPEMRVQLALSKPALREDRILSNSGTWLDATPSHSVSDFSKLPKLTDKEKERAREIYVETLGDIELENFGSDEFKERLYGGKPLRLPLSGEKYLTGRDEFRLKKVEEDLRKRTKDSYEQIMSDMPAFGYLERDNKKGAGEAFNRKEIDKAYSKIEEELSDFLKELEDPEVDMGKLLALEPLVEELLTENSGYCSIAESAKREADKLDVKETLSLLRDSVLAATPCIARGVFWTTVCVAGGLYVGFRGLNIVSQEKKEAFDRFLTGKEFETLGSLSDKERELYFEKIFFPLGVWGDTAAMAKALGKSLKGARQLTRARIRNAASQARQNLGTFVRDEKRGKDYTIDEIRELIRIENSRLLSDYDFLRLSRTPDEQRLVEETVVRLELDGMDQQEIYSKVRSAVDQCTVK